MNQAPIIIRIRRRKSALLGIGVSMLALFGLGFAGFAVFAVQSGFWLVATSLFIASVFGAVSIFFFGIAYRNPVALRLDANGVSGYYLAPATWDEIAEISAFTETHDPLRGTKVTNRFLGFKLYDPIAFRDRQNPWGRLKSWSSGRSSGYHLIVPQSMIDGFKIDDLATLAQTFHDGATRKAKAPHKDVT